MDGVLAQERVREHWDRQPCDSELSSRGPTSRDFYLDVERHRILHARKPSSPRLTVCTDTRS